MGGAVATRSWPALAGFAIVVAHLPQFLHRLLDGDEAIYGSIAVLMNLGGGLYGDGGVDNKPPAIFWIYALTFRVGTVDFSNLFDVAVSGSGFLLFALYLSVAFGRLYGQRASAAAEQVR